MQCAAITTSGGAAVGKGFTVFSTKLKQATLQERCAPEFIQSRLRSPVPVAREPRPATSRVSRRVRLPIAADSAGGHARELHRPLPSPHGIIPSRTSVDPPSEA